MKTNFSLLFYLKRQKDYTTGVAPIYLRITVNGKRAELATGKECEPEQWNSKTGHIRGTKEDTKTFNVYLDKMKAGVTAAHTTLCLQDYEVTTESVKCKYLGKAEKSHTLAEAITLHNKNMKALVGKDYAPGTLKRFEVLYLVWSEMEWIVLLKYTGSLLYYEFIIFALWKRLQNLTKCISAERSAVSGKYVV